MKNQLAFEKSDFLTFKNKNIMKQNTIKNGETSPSVPVNNQVIPLTLQNINTARIQNPSATKLIPFSLFIANID